MVMKCEWAVLNSPMYLSMPVKSSSLTSEIHMSMEVELGSDINMTIKRFEGGPDVNMSWVVVILVQGIIVEMTEEIQCSIMSLTFASFCHHSQWALRAAAFELAATAGIGTLGKGERGSSELSTKPQNPLPCRVCITDLLQAG